jgi:hypothetical protein
MTATITKLNLAFSANTQAALHALLLHQDEVIVSADLMQNFAMFYLMYMGTHASRHVRMMHTTLTSQSDSLGPPTPFSEREESAAESASDYVLARARGRRGRRGRPPRDF